MLRKSLAILLTLSLLFISSAVTAQQDKTPLTNDDIVKMLKVKLPESTIVTVIEVSPTNFDTSREAIEKLRRAGAGAPIIEAVRAALAKRRAPDEERKRSLTTVAPTAAAPSVAATVAQFYVCEGSNRCAANSPN